MSIGTLLVVLALFAGYLVYQQVVSYVFPDGPAPATHLESRGKNLIYGKSSATHLGNIPVLRLHGSPFAIGHSHGRLLGARLAEVNRAFLPNIAGTVSSDDGVANQTRLRWQYRLLDDGIPGYQIMELAGMVRGAWKTTDENRPGYEHLLRQQATLDVALPAPWTSAADSRALARALTFLTTLRGPSGDRILIGRTFSLPGLSDGGDALRKNTVLSFIKPVDKTKTLIPFASIGWAGMAGVVTGINAEGIAVLLHPSRTTDVALSRKATPSSFLARDVLENARSLQDAIAILEQGKVLGAAVYAVIDGNARVWAIVERSPTHINVTKNPTPTVFTSLMTSETFAPDPNVNRAHRHTPDNMRKKRLSRLLRTSPPRVPADAANLLCDTRAINGAPLPLGHRGAIQDIDALHSVIIDASRMVLWVADGPGACSRYRAIDLRFELRGEGVRPQPPSDIPAHVEFDQPQALAVLRARAHLRKARQSSGLQQREYIQRALANVPDLPEALKLAGDVAIGRGKKQEALRYFEQYLEGGADSPEIADVLRARIQTLQRQKK